MIPYLRWSPLCGRLRSGNTPTAWRLSSAVFVPNPPIRPTNLRPRAGHYPILFVSLILRRTSTSSRPEDGFTWRGSESNRLWTRSRATVCRAAVLHNRVRGRRIIVAGMLAPARPIARTRPPRPNDESNVLVDCHNLWDPWPSTLLDLEAAVASVYYFVTSLSAPLLAPFSDVRVRFYDGWRDVGGNPTRRARLLLELLPQLRGLRHGVRLHPSIAEAPLDATWSPLRGTFRTVPFPPHQKMVDVLIAIDLVRLSATSSGPILLLSDDDDYVPALLVASSRTSACITAVRSRPLGRAANDHFLSAAGVSVMVR